jgi:hypothetical protein
VTGSQIWLNPLVDDCQITYTTNLKKEKRKNTCLDAKMTGTLWDKYW